MKAVLIIAVAAFAMMFMTSSAALAAEAKVLKGTIQSVKGATFVVGSANEKVTTFRIGSQAGDLEPRVTLNGKSSSFEIAVKPSREVAVTYMTVGEESMATEVAVTTAEK